MSGKEPKTDLDPVFLKTESPKISKECNNYDVVSRYERFDAKVPSRYELVNVVACRARQISNEAEQAGEHLEDKPVTIALHEVADGKLEVEDPQL